MYCKMSHWQYTVVDTLVGRAAPELNMGKLGDWLEGEARRSATGKVAHLPGWAFGSCNRFAQAGHSLRK
jgi:hypothetical protein